ncbi:MAG TPA: hypothetical protein VFQ35_17780 [Polyangiaceae bacterium]|nr:hypothetical protein [Polyangiaceae bacterium]
MTPHRPLLRSHAHGLPKGLLCAGIFVHLAALVFAGCGGSGGSSGAGGTGVGSGGAPALGGANSSGGVAPTSGGTASGGTTTASGGASTASGGKTTGGGASSGGASSSSGGKTGSGGANNAGTSSAQGGATSTGGVTSNGGTSAGCTDFQTPTKVGDIAETALDGPSGIAASRAHAGVLYAHLDAGGGAVVYAMTYAGKALGAYTLMGITATDWEDIAVGPCANGDCIYIGDIGDNAARMGGTTRTQIQVLRVAEPNVSATQAATQQMLGDVTIMRFTYPDKAHDAETLMVDPVTKDILIITKETDGNSSIFRAAANTPADMPTVLEKVGNVQIGASGQAAQASAGDISPTGDRFIVRSYTAILLWPRAATFAATFAATPKMVPSPTETQGEGLTFTSDGKAWLSAGERSRAIYEGVASCP